MTKAKQNNTATVNGNVDIHKLALALLRINEQDVNIQQQITNLVATMVKNDIQPAYEDKGDDLFNEQYLTCPIVTLIADIKDSGKNDAARKRAIDDTAKRVQRASEAIDKALTEAKQPSPFRDSDDKLRRLSISKGTKKKPSVYVKFMPAKADTTLETHVKSTLAWIHKNELKVSDYIAELEKQLSDKVKADAEKAKAA